MNTQLKEILNIWPNIQSVCLNGYQQELFKLQLITAKYTKLRDIFFLKIFLDNHTHCIYKVATNFKRWVVPLLYFPPTVPPLLTFSKHAFLNNLTKYSKHSICCTGST